MSKKNMILLYIGIVLIVAALIGGWYFLGQRGNPTLKEGELTIGNARFTVEIASTTIERMNGLSFRTSLAADHGMLFLFDAPTIQNFWMKDTNIPLDMIWIASDTVAGFAENVQPEPGVPLWSLKIYSSPDGVDKVLEVNAGTVAKYGIKVGDKVEFGI